MRPIISFIAILASHALAVEPVKGQLNGLDRRQTTDYCGTDLAGDNLWCINSSCCESGSTGIWSCYGPEDQCCATGYTCLSGSQCYLDSLDQQLCVQGSNTIAATTGSAPQTSSSAAAPTKTMSSPGTSTTHVVTTTSSHAGGVWRTANALAKMGSLAGAAALLL